MTMEFNIRTGHHEPLVRDASIALDHSERSDTSGQTHFEIDLAGGTRILCAEGRLSVEDLHAGSMVWTLDHGLQPLKVLHRNRVRFTPANGHMRPIRISAGALGRGCPTSDLVMAPENRVLVTGWRAELFFGRAEYLAPAHALLSMPGIERVTDCDHVDYFGLVFAQRAILEVGGIMADGQFLGASSRGALGRKQRDSISALQLFSPDDEDGR
ncbi:Hint domain-containing protein [Oceaniglobus roseus]|uniref:Hint domain-containing protein n=1 Tax=Oceaniglobus roseus TaxID=1737570 RepID=UPI000C7E9031|nr:Hint domain-containing protein [Kandeliimicrobium roseum]